MAHLLSNDFFDRNMDPRVREFPLMKEGTWKVLAIAAVYVIFAKLWNPKTSKSSLDLRPWLLIQNGFAFGCHGAGLIVALILSGFGRDSFDCSPLTHPKRTAELTFEYIKSESIIHLSAVLLFLRIFLLTEGLLIKLLKDRPVSNARIVNDVSLLLFCYVGFKYLPGGPSFFFAITYVIFNTFNYGYHTLKFGSFSTDDMLSSWNRIFIALQFLWALSSLGHSMYLLFITSCNAQSNVFPLAMMEILHSLGTFYNFSNSIRKNGNNKKIHSM